VLGWGARRAASLGAFAMVDVQSAGELHLSGDVADQMAAQPLREYWAERCMYEVMKLESNTFERIEQMEKSFESQIREALKDCLQPSAEAPCISSLAAAVEDVRNDLNSQRRQREVEMKLHKKEVPSEQSQALQELVQNLVAHQAQLTETALSVDLNQGFERLRANLGMEPTPNNGVRSSEQAEQLESHICDLSHRADASDKQIMELQLQRSQTDFSLGGLHARLQAAETAAFDIEEPASLGGRLGILEASSNQDMIHDTNAKMLQTRVELLENSIALRLSGGDEEMASTSETLSSHDVRCLFEALKAAVAKTQTDIIEVAQGLHKERSERKTALTEVDSLCHVVAKAAASAIERLDLTVGAQDGRSPPPFASAALSAIGAAATVSSGPSSPQEMTAQLRVREFEESVNRELVHQSQRLEVIDSSTKAALLKQGEKYQAACELGTRTLLLEKAVKWLLEVGMSRQRDGSPPADVQALREDGAMPGGFDSTGLPPFALQRLMSSGPRTSSRPPSINSVLRSQSQPIWELQTPLTSLRPAPGHSPALAQSMPRTLAECSSLEPRTLPSSLEPRSLSKLWRSDSPALTPMMPQGICSPSPSGMLSQCSSQTRSTDRMLTVPGLHGVSTPTLSTVGISAPPPPMHPQSLQMQTLQSQQMPRQRAMASSPRQQTTSAPMNGRLSTSTVVPQQPGSQSLPTSYASGSTVTGVGSLTMSPRVSSDLALRGTHHLVPTRSSGKLLVDLDAKDHVRGRPSARPTAASPRAQAGQQNSPRPTAPLRGREAEQQRGWRRK